MGKTRVAQLPTADDKVVTIPADVVFKINDEIESAASRISAIALALDENFLPLIGDTLPDHSDDRSYHFEILVAALRRQAEILFEQMGTMCSYRGTKAVA